MASYSQSEYFTCAPEDILRAAREVFEEGNWSIVALSDDGIIGREGLVGFLMSGPVKIGLTVTRLQADASDEGSVRVDLAGSCLGLGPINKNRVKRLMDRFLASLMLKTPSRWEGD